MDVTKQNSIDSAFKEIQSYTKTLNAIVNFAGLTHFTSLIEGDSINAIEKNLDVNLIGTAKVNRTFFEMIDRGKGRIINCSSESGWMKPSPFAGPYVLSKSAVDAYNDSLRRELIYLGIPVIKIQPGAYDTKLTQQLAQYCDKLITESKYYKKLLEKMKPMMMRELKQKNDPNKLVNVVIRAMESKKT
jgi:NAD(P)-dependent dehydrogenase (short-subunit alcohol dehydrogenase family)